jgi:hypothetical protein
MSMIMRVHSKVCIRNAILPRSLEAERIAALLVREFQYGLSDEADLLAAFGSDGRFRLSVPVGKIDLFVGNALGRWEVDDALDRH